MLVSSLNSQLDEAQLYLARLLGLWPNTALAYLYPALAGEDMTRKRPIMSRCFHILLLVLPAIVITGCSSLNLGSMSTPQAVGPRITVQPASQSVTVGQAASFTVAAVGTAPLRYQWKKNGAGIAGASLPSYTTAATTSADEGEQFSVVISNVAGSVTSAVAVLTVNADNPLQITTSQVPGGTIAGTYSASFAASGGTRPYGWSLASGTLPAGLTLSSSGTISGAPSVAGSFPITVQVNDAAAHSASANFTLQVTSAGAALQVTTGQLPAGTTGGAYSTSLSASGGTTPYSWSLASGTLPAGLALSSSGTISGAPSVAGSFPLSIQVKDAAGHSAAAAFTIQITSPVPTVAITSPANGSTVSGTISVSGTASDRVALTAVQVAVDGGSFSNASGTNSWSFSLNTASLANGSHTFTAKVTDAAGVSASSSPLALTINNTSTNADCTLYASSSGHDSNSGTSPSAPRTFSGAAAVAQPGAVVCLLGGTYNLSSTFYPPTSGSPSAWIVYKNYGDGPVNFVWTGGAITQPMFKFGNGSFPSGAAYLEFRGFNLDGQNDALDGFFCQGGHHLRFIGNSINNTGGSGVGAVNCDYLTSDHNLINHNGYLYGWTSAVSYNNAQWFDSYAGFHNIASNNIISGEYDGSPNHTDGNGIILDLGSNTPPALIVNNVVYGNGGRCIQANGVTNFWIINNTCYKNDLDTSLGNVGSLVSQNSNNGYFINNLTQAWQSSNPSYDQEGTNTNIHYYANVYFGAPYNFSYSDPAQLSNADPLFLSPPSLAVGEYATALAPSLLGNGLTLMPLLSPALGKGIDPATVSGLPAAIVTDLNGYIYTDINGKPRPQGGGSDLGAYQH
jgi:Bacterial Ig domain/Putative Ig domain